MKVKVKYEGEAKLCNIEGAKSMTLVEFKKACKDARGVPDDADLKPNFRVRMWADKKNITMNSKQELDKAIEECGDDKPLKVIIKKKGDEEEAEDAADSE